MPQFPRSSEFSFDFYPSLDAELEAAYIRNLARGHAASENIATVGLATVIRNTLQQQPETSLPAEVQKWALKELGGSFNDGILSRWQLYDSLMPVPTPGLDILNNPKLVEAYCHLYEAKLALDASPETTPLGKRVGETMHLLLVPWQAFKEHGERLQEWMTAMRRKQGIASDVINSSLVDSLQNDTPLYRNPHWAANNTPAPRWLSARAYLEQRIATNGPWGVMLVQTSKHAGLKNFEGKSPNELTDYGYKHFEIAGYPVDSLGIFEWLAFTLQEDPKQLSRRDFSWLLANVCSGLYVPYGVWREDDHVESGIFRDNVQTRAMRPRIAVI